MNIRNQARAFLIHVGNLFRADVLAMYVQRLRCHRSHAVVVAMHETPELLRAEFRQQLEFAAQHFTITSLEDFAKLWEHPAPPVANSQPLLLFTFDDGRESNYTVAAPLLESFGGRGLFFVVPAFAELAGTKRALYFFQNRINPNSKLGDEDGADWKPMSPAQISDLASRGHAIGNHTLNHEGLRGLSAVDLEREIKDSAGKLALWTGKPVDCFAWTFGWDAIDAKAWQAILRRHRFCFSPCAGIIDPRRDRPSLLWRREIEARYSVAELRFAYSGLVDLWWGSRRRKLRDMLRESSAG
jgi:peptidoglycan/xylan/chitin deacetylase (PgdA/CDA1 family)